MMDKRPTRDQRREDTRARVYACALEVFRRDGVAEARIDDVTAAAGVSRGTFYFHFPTKEDVLAQLLAERTEKVADAVAELPDDAPLQELLTAVGDAIAAQWTDDARIFPHVATVALQRTAASPEAVGVSLRSLLADRLAAASGNGELVPGVPPEVLADLFLVQQFAVALAWCGNPLVPLPVALRGAAFLFLHGAAADRSRLR